MSRSFRMTKSDPLESILEQADSVAEDSGEATLRDLIEAFDDRAFGPVLTLLGLLALSPFGAIPGIPAVLALVLVLFAGQIVMGRSSPWLPGFVGSISIEEDKISSFQESASGWLSRIDGLLQPRLKAFAGALARRLAAGVTIVLAMAMVPLEAAPFAVAIPAAGIVLFGMGLTARDGLVMLFGFAASLGAAFGIWFLL
ncbi:MAG: exopolysaccharide biosynthesis protein [Pseudomonadota bacterium]